jgi:hypothetical protein
MQAFVSLRTAEFWLHRSYADLGAQLGLTDVHRVTPLGKAAGTHWGSSYGRNRSSESWGGRRSMHVFTALIGRGEAVIESQVAPLAPGQSLETLFEEIYKTDPDFRQRASFMIVRPPVEKPINPDAIARILAGEGEKLSASLRFLDEAAVIHIVRLAASWTSPC